MVDIESFCAILDACVVALPEELYKELNLGIGVIERAKPDRHAKPGRPLYILGEYRVHHNMGRGILLYYGSFRLVFPHLAAPEQLRPEIDRVLKHELTHHLESLAGSRDLEIADAKRLMRWREEGL